MLRFHTLSIRWWEISAETCQYVQRFNVKVKHARPPRRRWLSTWNRKKERFNTFIRAVLTDRNEFSYFSLFSSFPFLFFLLSVFPSLDLHHDSMPKTNEHRANQIDMSITTYRATRNSRDVKTSRSKEETRNLLSFVLFHPLELPCQKGRPKRRHPRWSIQTTRLTHRVHSLAHYWLGETSLLKRVHTGYEWRKSSTSRPTHDTDTRAAILSGYWRKPRFPSPPRHWRNNRGAWQRGAGEPPAESLPRKQRGQGRPLLNDDKYAVSSEVRCTRSTGALSWRLSRCRHGQRDLGCSLATPTRGSPNQHQLNRLPCLVPALPYRAAANLTAFPFHSTLSLSLLLRLFLSPHDSKRRRLLPQPDTRRSRHHHQRFPHLSSFPTINLAPNYSHHLAFCIPCHRWRSPLCVSSLAVLHGPRAPPRMELCWFGVYRVMRTCWSVARSVAWKGDARAFPRVGSMTRDNLHLLEFDSDFPRRYDVYCKSFDGIVRFPGIWNNTVVAHNFFCQIFRKTLYLDPFRMVILVVKVKKKWKKRPLNFVPVSISLPLLKTLFLDPCFWT